MATPEQLGREIEPRSLLRQGKFLLPSDGLRLDSMNPEGTLMIVASHDCDCVKPSTQESHIELMRARIIDAPNGNHTNAKTARLLHLAATKSGADITLEIKAGPKIAVPKIETLGMVPDSSIDLGESGRRTFSIWLRSRYWRGALPDALGDRFAEVKSAIADALKSSARAIHGVYIAFDPRVELPEHELYEVALFLVYNGEVQGAREAAEEAALKIKRKFETKFRELRHPTQPIVWKKIYLSACDAVSDTEFTLADTLNAQLLDLDHLSLRQDPQVSPPEI